VGYFKINIKNGNELCFVIKTQGSNATSIDNINIYIFLLEILHHIVAIFLPVQRSWVRMGGNDQMTKTHTHAVKESQIVGIVIMKGAGRQKMRKSGRSNRPVHTHTQPKTFHSKCV